MRLRRNARRVQAKSVLSTRRLLSHRSQKIHRIQRKVILLMSNILDSTPKNVRSAAFAMVRGNRSIRILARFLTVEFIRGTLPSKVCEDAAREKFKAGPPLRTRSRTDSLQANK